MTLDPLEATFLVGAMAKDFNLILQLMSSYAHDFWRFVVSMTFVRLSAIWALGG